MPSVAELSAPYENFLVAPRHGADVCSLCFNLTNGYGRCYACAHCGRWLDAMVPISYSVAGEQLHHALAGYKRLTGPPARRLGFGLAAVLWRFLTAHEQCLARAVNADSFSVVTTVPSTASWQAVPDGALCHDGTASQCGQRASAPPTDPEAPPTDPSTPPAGPSTPPAAPGTPPAGPNAPAADTDAPSADLSAPPEDVAGAQARRHRAALQELVGDLVGPTRERYETLLRASGLAVEAHRYDPERFVATRELQGESVLLIDDTWTTGANAQSAACALKTAGAGKVAAVVIGRHVNREWEHNDRLLRGLAQPFDWNRCALCQV